MDGIDSLSNGGARLELRILVVERVYVCENLLPVATCQFRDVLRDLDVRDRHDSSAASQVESVGSTASSVSSAAAPPCVRAQNTVHAWSAPRRNRRWQAAGRANGEWSQWVHAGRQTESLIASVTERTRLRRVRQADGGAS